MPSISLAFQEPSLTSSSTKSRWFCKVYCCHPGNYRYGLKQIGSLRFRFGGLPDAARLVGQHRLDGGPFIIAKFVAHDSRLRFGSLNHGSGSAINPHRPTAKPLMF